MKTQPGAVEPNGAGFDAARLFDGIAAFSRDGEGFSRPALSAVETEALTFLAHFGREQGLAVRFDAGQNAVFSLPQDADAERYILVGSHVDTVPNGGNFDGLAGVVAGLLCLVRARQAGLRFSQPVKVIALRAEESAWFGPCYIASKALLGRLGEDELNAVHKADGRTLGAHMAEVGINMNRVREQVPLVDPDAIIAYLELHIEQGPLLVEMDLPAAVVSGLRGNMRYKTIRCVGEAGHSGAVPRAYRKDPVLAMADLLSRLDESWLTVLQKGEDLVLTSGIVATDPARHALSRIPDVVDFSLEFRSQSDQAIAEMRGLLNREMATVGRERGVQFETGTPICTAPALCDAEIVEGLQAAMQVSGRDPFVMPSGAGHDAAVFANAGIPTGMLFVRNRNGSHNPDEAMEIDDLVAGADILFTYLTRVLS